VQFRCDPILDGKSLDRAGDLSWSSDLEGTVGNLSVGRAETCTWWRTATLGTQAERNQQFWLALKKPR